MVATVNSSPVASAIFATTPGAPGSGMIANVPAGGPYTVRLRGYSGTGGTGSLLFQGEVGGVTVLSGQIAPTSSIVMNSILSLDNTFASPNGYVAVSGLQSARAIKYDVVNDKIYLLGANVNQTALVLFRFNGDGSPDTLFNGTGTTGNNFITDLGPANSTINTPLAMALDSAGNIVVTGWTIAPTSQCNATTPVGCMTLWRFIGGVGATAGQRDATFNGGAPGTYPSIGNNVSEGWAVLVDGSGRIVVSGDAYNATRTSRSMTMWRVLADGTPDTTFAPASSLAEAADLGSDAYGVGMVIDGAGKFVVTGISGGISTRQMYLWRYNPVTPGFDALGGAGSVSSTAGQAIAYGQAVAQDASNRILVAGYSGADDSQGSATVWRYPSNFSNSSLDTSFNGTGFALATGSPNTVHSNAGGLVLDSQGHIIVVGSGTVGGKGNVMAWKFTDTGVMDATSNSGVFATGETAGANCNDSGGPAVIDTTRSRLLIAGSSCTSVVIWAVGL